MAGVYMFLLLTHASRLTLVVVWKQKAKEQEIHNGKNTFKKEFFLNICKLKPSTFL